MAGLGSRKRTQRIPSAGVNLGSLEPALATPADLLGVTCRVSVPSYSIERESLDTEGMAFRMCRLWEVALEREKIAKLNGSS